MSWFVVVQYLPDNLKIGVVSLKSALQLMWWFVVVCGGSIMVVSWWFVVVRSGFPWWFCGGSW